MPNEKGVIMDTDRRTGRTTHQLRTAPPGAIYLWPLHLSLGYVKDLAQALGRGDLICMAYRPTLLDGLRRRYGQGGWNKAAPPMIVVDHATAPMLTPAEHLAIAAWNCLAWLVAESLDQVTGTTKTLLLCCIWLANTRAQRGEAKITDRRLLHCLARHQPGMIRHSHHAHWYGGNRKEP